MKGKNYKEDTTPEDVSDDQRTGGVFNMGIATLERINDVLKRYKKYINTTTENWRRYAYSKS